MQNLKGLKFKMLPILLRNHTYTEKRTCFFKVKEEGLEFDKDDIKFNDDAIKFLEQIREGTDELLKEVIEEQIKIILKSIKQ
ncbi:hypothetical protein [Delftia tsuruhatensis]|uniref:hypothetical protein n=1 Tax=Delftia tsuruhatensis TaxID=180282 RepID=UPI003A871718